MQALRSAMWCRGKRRQTLTCGTKGKWFHWTLLIQRDEHWKSPESRTYINIVCKRASWLQSELIESSNCNNCQTVGWIWIQVVVFLSQDLPVLQLPSTILKSMQLPSATYQASVFWPQGATHDEVTPSTAYLAEALGVLFQGLQRISPNGWPPWQRWHRQREKNEDVMGIMKEKSASKSLARTSQKLFYLDSCQFLE